MTAPIVVSVVLAVRNGAATLGAQLEALALQDYGEPWELVVVDNRSSDGSVAVARSFESRIPALRVVSDNERLGPGWARNAGVGNSLGDILLFCDADDAASPGWVRHMVQALASAHLAGGPLDLVRLNTPDAAAEMQGLHADRLPLGAAFMPFVPGGNMGITRAMFDEVGGFDPAFMCQEDVDLSWRVAQRGGVLAFAPGALMHYRLRPSLAALGRQQFRAGRDEARLYKRYRATGMRRTPPHHAARIWAIILARAVQLRTGEVRRRRWMRSAAHRTGRLVGAVENRVLYW